MGGSESLERVKNQDEKPDMQEHRYLSQISDEGQNVLLLLPVTQRKVLK